MASAVLIFATDPTTKTPRQSRGALRVVDSVVASRQPDEPSDDTRSESKRLELVRRVAAGDSTALGELYDSASKLVFSLASKILRDPSLAEEVALEVFVQVWRTADRYDSTRGTPSAWMLTITRTRSIDRLRSGAQERKRREPMEAVERRVASGETDPEEAAVASERAMRVRASLDALPAEQKHAIELAYFSGMSHSEIASSLGLPLGTVKTRIRLGMDRLRALLGSVE